MHVLFLDTETTDAGDDARLIQLAYKNGEEEVNEYFKAPVRISYGAMAVHHVTNEMVEDKPAFQESEHYNKIAGLLQNHVMVAHNAPFDIRILQNEGLTVGKNIDTLRVARHVLESQQFNLQYLRYSMHLNVEGTAHDAMGDVRVLEAVFSKLKDVVADKFGMQSDEDVIGKMIELSETPVLLQEITFGKHRGRTYADVSATDRGYLEWLYGSETQKKESEQNTEMVHTLKHHLGLLV